ncbi:carboxypeptidase regulatory-like domain-containing protein [Pontibacter sp. Tf4]|uniref:carboxypeptidase-like regulatory domain-containing protein n=1 Tax=Pontibacter sp. Tf4 TaxID=2761620 RepID=UPI00162357A4|nr:carboxypeptidase-like regulatory domain-containing protein [Pontibacter sp. Tf4]MBB6610010.1 carboxypeptidase regulatory-like domain-containing protein [Pontibacter sp. Tf4]
MRKLNKLYLLFFVALLLTSCEKEETVTEISGRVLDIETNTPVANASLNLTVAEGINKDGSFVNPVNHNTTSNSEGNYSFIIPENGQQELFRVTADKSGYVEARDVNYISELLKSGQKNQHDVPVAKGSYLTLRFKQTPSDSDKTLKLTITYTANSNESPLNGISLRSEVVTIDANTTETTVYRGFYYKQTSKVHLTWEVTGSDGKSETFNETIDLKEHDTVNFEISY